MYHTVVACVADVKSLRRFTTVNKTISNVAMYDENIMSKKSESNKLKIKNTITFILLLLTTMN